MLASLAPPIHLSGERLGWTVLICIVRDFRRMHLEVSWGSASEGHISNLPYSVARKQQGHSAVAIIAVATSDWPSYSCSVSHRPHSKVIRRHHATSSGRPGADDKDNLEYYFKASHLTFPFSLLKLFFLFQAIETGSLNVMKRQRVRFNFLQAIRKIHDSYRCRYLC